ncbi:DUF1571 domain-containing protein [Candidatus Laterigemmans baculatus]|uniref:DUF1571 domain-containing protein n=1 Tax=Candidatus Laterigemmans baculatus TaxID=2770505 RepID=UPI0013DC177B|nr:DUF1571 domain-containing protein [Candidatus Laterigemmans baculatus]
MATTRRAFIAGVGAAAALAAGRGWAAPPDSDLKEPVYRVTLASNLPKQTQHSLDEGLAMAREALAHSRANYDDYTATLVKRERVDGVVGGPEYMFLKVRNRKVADGKLVSPLSVYLTFLSPASTKGREVIYVENRNDGYITAHEGGIKGRFLPTVTIHPTGALAMRGQRYPMTEIGLENLMVKLLERGETARQYPDVKAEFRKNARVKDRTCTVLQVTQPTKRPDLDFYLAQVFIDDELRVPIRYVAYDWPKSEGEKPEVIEEYTYLDLKVNVGLTDADFDVNNPSYSF